MYTLSADIHVHVQSIATVNCMFTHTFVYTHTHIHTLNLPTQRYHVQELEEPEPEWMEFGPTDRFDIIELKGFDKEELEREGTMGI